MGLDTTHNCWHGPYSTFNRFRYSLGKQIGIDLNDYFGYGGKNPTKYLSDIDHDLMPLFNHSDCDGELTVDEAAKISIGLDKVLINFIENDEYDFDFKERIIQFRDGCLYAISKREIIKFQ